MKSKLICRLGSVPAAALLLIGSLTLGPEPVYAATLQQAVQDYNAGRYGPALHEFQELSTSLRGAQAVLAHYYMALCLQNTGQYERAKIEYAWVGTYGDARMKAMAATGAAQLGRGQPQLASSGASESPGHSPTPSGAAQGKVKRVLEFYTDW